MHKLHVALSVTILVLLIGVAPVFISDANAAQLTMRSIRILTSEISATTVHDYNFTLVSAGDIGSISFEYCSNSPLFEDSCTIPSGLDTSVPTFVYQGGETGFSIHSNTNSNKIVITRPVATPTPQAVQYTFGNIVNPDALGSYYVRIATYLTDDGTGVRTDEAGLAFATTPGLGVTAYVPPVLVFCVGSTITGNDCSTATGSLVNLGVFDSIQPSTSTSQMAAATNGVGGYTISMIGNTMTSGNNIIQPMSAVSNSASGSAQFGLNLRANNSPVVGSLVTGPGSGVVAPDYNQTNRFKFQNGDVLASSSISTDMNTYTTSYLVNVADAQSPGYYTSTITFIALASF